VNLIELKCDWNGNFTLIEPGGPPYIMWFYTREEWDKCQKHMWSLVRKPQGDPR